jgi:FkbM family methyltransferase
MTKLEVIRRLLGTTSNFWVIATLKSGKKAKVSFRNGARMDLDLLEYRKMRDFFTSLNGTDFTIKKTGNSVFITKNQPLFRCGVPSVELIPFYNLLFSLSDRNWTVEQTDTSTFEIQQKAHAYNIQCSGTNQFLAKSNSFSLTGPLQSLKAYFLEFEEGAYDYNYNGKVVLDIGGFCGESAVFFKVHGAKKVIIYEPVKEHHALITKNVNDNGINAEVHTEGIGEKDGVVSISYEETGLSFGVLSEGSKKLEIKVKSAADIISQSHADVAKVDCEGAETSLVSVPREVLRAIKYYIVETHTKEIQDAIVAKFLESGFTLVHSPMPLVGETVLVDHFQEN